MQSKPKLNMFSKCHISSLSEEYWNLENKIYNTCLVSNIALQKLRKREDRIHQEPFFKKGSWCILSWLWRLKRESLGSKINTSPSDNMNTTIIYTFTAWTFSFLFLFWLMLEWYRETKRRRITLASHKGSVAEWLERWTWNSAVA